MDQYPAMILNEHLAMAPSCPSCGREHAFSVNDLMETPSAPEEPSRAKVTPIRPEIRISVTDEVTDIFLAIEKRLAVLDTELAKFSEYREERKKLVRMLAAAEKSK